jgi:iron complex transport system ATP-binding protein
MKKNIIEFENIHVGYDSKIVLRDINITIKKDEHWAILGANGSGKSTLMKLIQSEIHPRRDYPFKKEILGETLSSIFELKKKLGIITNDLHNHFYTAGSFLTGYEVVISGYYSSIGVFKHQDFSEEQHKKTEETLEYLHISKLKDKKVKTMSTGELRKCIMARALIHDPVAFVLDEPTVGLDIKAQIDFIEMLKRVSLKSSIILVTHHLEEIFEGITHVALIDDKTIFKSGKKEDILTSENLSQVFDISLHLKEKNKCYFIEEILQEI